MLKAGLIALDDASAVARVLVQCKCQSGQYRLALPEPMQLVNARVSIEPTPAALCGNGSSMRPAHP